jgi:hypothetical protein
MPIVVEAVHELTFLEWLIPKTVKI